jgi:hypothetical protein
VFPEQHFVFFRLKTKLYKGRLFSSEACLLINMFIQRVQLHSRRAKSVGLFREINNGCTRNETELEQIITGDTLIDLLSRKINATLCTEPTRRSKRIKARFNRLFFRPSPI